MSEIYYSTDEEVFNYDDIGEAICSIFECDDTLDVGTIITIYSGEAIKFNASSFVKDITEDMSERAYDEIGEHADNWPDCNKEQREDLEKLMAKTVDSWASKHNLHPKFWGIKNQKEIKVKILNIETGNFEILEA